ncbi:sperm-associated antigen 1-like isoform X1 [Polypterus senegalus]|nr:sperm-associated antigen 1-like isoform X1 [Polypterus senegalus]
MLKKTLLAKMHSIPVEHLDYNFIKNCSDVKTLERILGVLRSGDEGIYPHLTEFCEKKIENLYPESRALRKDKAPATAVSFTSQEWQDILTDLENWTSDIKGKEEEIKQQFIFENCEKVPSVHGSNVTIVSSREKAINEKPKRKKRIAPRDYKEWDKIDIDKECAEVDEKKDKEDSVQTVVNSSLSKIKRSIDCADLSDIEKKYIANHEKNKGNEAFAAKDYDEAITYYTRSISVMPSVAAYNNRAQAEIKLCQWTNALNDCQKVLEVEPKNLKGILRRATVYLNTGNFKASIADLTEVIQAEPSNPTVKKILNEVQIRMGNMQSKEKVKGKKILIEQMDDTNKEKLTADSSSHVGGETAATAFEKSVMGNVQKKFPSRGDIQPETDERGLSPGTKENAEKANKETESTVQSTEAKDQRLKNKNLENGKYAGNHSSTSGSDESRPQLLTSGVLPPAVACLKEQGNELFKNGQFGEAVIKYTQAITDFEKCNVDSPGDLSILYSNRAACFLKNGNCADCIEDCTRALALQPFTVKPLLRRAMAFESMERYRQAYVDYKTVLQIDSGIQAANTSVNRLTRLLIDLDGEEWRGKLPEIPSVTLSFQQCRLKEVVLKRDEKNDGVLSEQEKCKVTEEMFLSFKQKGNDFVKTSQYNEALKQYSECLKLNPSDSAIYSNRALCHLKLNQSEEVIQDCNSALLLEPSNVKAYYRRGLAYKNLQNYIASINDFKEVLQIAPHITEAKRELKEVTDCLKKQHDSCINQKQRKKIPIQEVSNSDEEGETGEIRSIPGSVLSVNHQHGFIDADPSNWKDTLLLKPTNAYEFGQILNTIKVKSDVAACAELLCNVTPENMPLLMSCELDTEALAIMIQALDRHLLQKSPEVVYSHLMNLQKAARFEMVCSLLGKSEKDQVKLLFDHLSATESKEFTPDDIQKLANRYFLHEICHRT